VLSNIDNFHRPLERLLDDHQAELDPEGIAQGGCGAPLRRRSFSRPRRSSQGPRQPS
jgi:hypothetical protein